MWEPLRILLLDSDYGRRENCRTLINFIGESCDAIDSDEWVPQSEHLDQYLAIFLGSPFNASAMEITPELDTLLELIKSSSKNIPLILLRENDVQVDESIEKIILQPIKYPLNYHELLNCLYSCQIARGNQHIRRQAKENQNDQMLIGNSKSMINVRKLVSQVAASDATVLITGESGTGKEVVAQQIHELSKRCAGPFVPVNCGAIPAELLESELFGHEKGAFTGAITARQGRFELAKGGTLFLDEIGDMPLNMQVKLLRVLQERVFERVGSSKSTEANVRIITATNRNLENEIKAGNFREDLYYRINVFPIELPSLHHRAEDIPALVNQLISRFKSKDNGSIRFMPAAMKAFKTYSWPGNIRELANMIERLTIMYPHGIIDINDLPNKFYDEEYEVKLEQPSHCLFSEDEDEQYDIDIPVLSTENFPSSGLNLKEYLHEMELNYIKQALNECNGVVAHAAELLQMRRTTLVEKMRKHGLGRNDQTAAF